MHTASREILTPLPVIPAELAGLNELELKQVALDLAWTYANDWQQPEVVALEPADSVHAEALYAQHENGSRSSLTRFWAMRQLSLQDGPHSDDAWNETIMAASEPGGITFTS
jgi:hypothetical protein